MPLPQIYGEKYWQAEIGKLYGVEGILFMLIVDGDTGEILDSKRSRPPGRTSHRAGWLGRSWQSNERLIMASRARCVVLRGVASRRIPANVAA
jgi:hypothetical protein